jgi:EmrB/QacA subfamily drug resistance transporter
MADTQPAAASAAPSLASQREIKIVLPGLLLAILLATLDQSIVGTAIRTIADDLNGLSVQAWVTTAYLITSTITTPIYGKLGDLYGRKKLFLSAIVIFLVGSALSGLSQSMTELIAFRALQGLGAGGLMVGAIAILGELVSPRERGKYMGYIMAVMMLATIGGPLAGGAITDNISWRWVFYINLPIGGFALVYLSRVLKLPGSRTEHVIDYAGAAVLAIAATALVLLTTWGGTQYGWTSPQILSLAVIAVAGTAAFLLVESRAAEPMLPLHLFRIRNFSLVAGLSFLVGLALFGAVTFLPLYQQTVQGASATVSGLLLTPMMVGVMVTSIIAGQITSKTGRYKMLPVVGSAGMGVGMWLLTMLGPSTSRVTSGLFFVVLGLGMGLLMQTTSLMAQNSVELRDIGVASSSRLFFQQIGGSIGVSVFGAIFARRLTDSISSSEPGTSFRTANGQFDPATVARLPLAVRHDVFVAIAHAIDGVFIWCVPAMAAAFVVALFIKEIPLRGRPDEAAAPSAEAPELVG